jgi:hypothetical protein
MIGRLWFVATVGWAVLFFALVGRYSGGAALEGGKLIATLAIGLVPLTIGFSYTAVRTRR